MSALDHAIRGLVQAIDAPPRPRTWRRLVRHRLGAVRETLSGEDGWPVDAWLAPRQSSLVREREALLLKLDHLGGLLLDIEDIERVRIEVRRLLGDLEHHRRRWNDLAYDAASLELGGSE